MSNWKKRLTPKLDDNLAFIWYDLMNDRTRQLALHALSRVIAGSALLVGVPYAIGFYIDGLTNQLLDTLLVGGILFLILELSGVLLGWLQQRIREFFFQEAFWYMPQAITRLYYQRPLSWLSSGTSEIDGGGMEGLRQKIWNVTGSYIFQIIPGWGYIIFGLLACLYANIGLGLLVLFYVMVERYMGQQVNKRIYTDMQPVIDQFKWWERRMQARWHSHDHVKEHGIESKISGNDEAKVMGMIHDEVQPALRGDDAVWRVYFAKRIVTQRLRSLGFALGLYSLLGYLVFVETLSLAVAVLVFFSFERIRSTITDLNTEQRDVLFNMTSIAKYRRVLQTPVPFMYNIGRMFNELNDAKDITVTFDHVSHTVNDGGSEMLVLRDVNLTIFAGQRIGIVGPSGAGKSQLLSLLVRSTDPHRGRVLINDTNLREWRLESLLRYYGVIMQKSEPFEDTVLGNLLFPISHFDLPDEGGHSASYIETMAIEALRKAGLDAEQFPNGLYTNIGYKGLKLSGGQQQRLQIAAAHLKLNWTKDRPRLILADEPTASLDSLSELTVMKHLSEQLPNGTTMLMVAHRLSTVAAMDGIIFVRPLALCDDDTTQVTVHRSLAELYATEALFREMADAQGFRP